MSRKSQAAYEHAFAYIDSNIFKLTEVSSFTTDYELAMRNAIIKTSPNAKMVACHFHFCQAAKRRASQIDGFVNFIRSNTEAASIYYRLMALPLLPSSYIRDSFNELKDEAYALNRNRFKKYLTYFKNQWINKVI